MYGKDNLYCEYKSLLKNNNHNPRISEEDKKLIKKNYIRLTIDEKAVLKTKKYNLSLYDLHCVYIDKILAFKREDNKLTILTEDDKFIFTSISNKNIDHIFSSQSSIFLKLGDTTLANRIMVEDESMTVQEYTGVKFNNSPEFKFFAFNFKSTDPENKQKIGILCNKDDIEQFKSYHRRLRKNDFVKNCK